jgi:hypothetical protein
MAAGTLTIPNKAKLNIEALGLLSASNTFKMALVGSGWAPDNSDTGNEVWGDVSANEIAAGNGYTAGGATLTGVTLTQTGGTVKFASGNPSWAATGAGFPAWRRAVIYAVGTFGGKVNPIIGHCLGDATPADVPATTTSNSPLTITCPAAGWITTV